MNQRYDPRTEEMKANDPTSKQVGSLEDDLRYSTAGHQRTITFIWPDGVQEALDYNYLIHRKFDPAISRITLLYTTHSVVVNGSGLQKLFTEIVDGITRKVIVTDKRYASLETDSIVTEIIVTIL